MANACHDVTKVYIPYLTAVYSFSEIECKFAATFWDGMTSIKWLVSFCFTRSSVYIFLLGRILMKTISKKFHGVYVKKKSLFFKILWWQPKHVRKCMERGFFSNCFFFLFHDVAKKYPSYGFKTSRKSEIKHPFQLDTCFHVLDTFYTSCISELAWSLVSRS